MMIKRIFVSFLLVISFILILGFKFGTVNLARDASEKVKNNTPQNNPTPTYENDIFYFSGIDFDEDFQDIAWDGKYFWMTNEGSRPPHDNYILKVSSDAKIVGKWRSSSYCECGATYDGEYLWTTGAHNPNGIQPPWEDPENYELIYKYSIDNGTPSLISRYCISDSPRQGIGNTIAFDREGKLWVTDGVGENKMKFLKLELSDGVTAQYHPGLDDVWTAKIISSFTVNVENWRIKGFEWILWGDGTDEIIVGGYDWIAAEDKVGDKSGIFIIDPVNSTVKWSYIKTPEDVFDCPLFGSFGMTWDKENEILSTFSGGGDPKILKHSKKSSPSTYIDALFGNH